jgi:glycosyltransferase involved in cell wall biosynthesis
MVGRLQAWKGQKDFLEAARIVLQKHPNARFLIVGDVVQSEPHFRDELVELAGQLGIGKSVVFTGHRSDIRAIFSITDIAVCASWYEPFGRVVAEAMAMAKPVIGTRAGGIPDIIVDGETGYLVNPRDPSSLAGGICAILTDRDKGREMGRLGRMRVLAHFDMVNVTRKVTRVFDLVFSGHRSAE